MLLSSDRAPALRLSVCDVAATEYEVEVVTGQKWGSGTDAEAFIVLQGEKGDSGKRYLRKNKEGGDMFESGKVSMTSPILRTL